MGDELLDGMEWNGMGDGEGRGGFLRIDGLADGQMGI